MLSSRGFGWEKRLYFSWHFVDRKFSFEKTIFDPLLSQIKRNKTVKPAEASRRIKEVRQTNAKNIREKKNELEARRDFDLKGDFWNLDDFGKCFGAIWSFII